MKKSQESSNIKTAYILSLLSDLFFPITAWLFFYLRYLNFSQIVVITAIGGIMSNILQIPTGAFADIVGRKKAIFVSYLFFAIGMFGTAYSTSFWFFLIFAIFNSFSNALYEGSLDALVYDSLKDDGKLNSYDSVVSKVESLIWIGLFIGALIGGFMYQLWFRLPFVAEGIIACIAAIITLYLKEPATDTRRYDIRQFLRQNIVGFEELFQNIKIAQVSLLFVVVTAGYFIASSILGISQAKEYGLSPGIIGIVFAIGYLISAGVSYMYPTIRKMAKINYILGIVIILLICTFIFAKFVGVVAGCILIIARIASSTTFRNTRSVVMNKFFNSKNRATALSTLVLLSQLPYALLSYTIGDYIQKNSPNSFAFVMGMIMIGILLIEIFAYGLWKKLSHASLV